MNRYRSGAEFERVVRTDLLNNGYYVVRSAGSKTKIDLIAIKRGEILFVQCKRDGRVGPAERTELIRVARLVDAQPILAYRAGSRRTLTYAKLLNAGDREEWSPNHGLLGPLV